MSKTTNISSRQAVINAAVKAFFTVKSGIQRSVLNAEVTKYAWVVEKATGKVDVADLLVAYRAGCATGNPKLFLGNLKTPVVAEDVAAAA